MGVTEHEFPLPGGGAWVVQAFEFPGDAESYAVYERLVVESRGTKGNFSVWRTTNPERTVFFVVTCAQREHLPTIEGGVPHEFSCDEAHQFALRRARFGKEAEEKGGTGWIEEEIHYDQPMQIDPATGEVQPYRQRESS